jgi:hypothetical protein
MQNQIAILDNPHMVDSQAVIFMQTMKIAYDIRKVYWFWELCSDDYSPLYNNIYNRFVSKYMKIT